MLKNLKNALIAKKISVVALAALIGVTEKTANNKLNGETELRLK